MSPISWARSLGLGHGSMGRMVSRRIGGVTNGCGGVCALCGGRDHRVLFEEDVHVLACHRCGLVFLGDHGNDLKDLYREGYDFKLIAVKSKSETIDLFPENVEHNESVMRWIKSVCKPEGKSVLEVGCHAGYLLKRLRREGSQIAGIEPNSRAVTFARWANRISNIQHCLLEEAREKETYDIVLLIQTFEHLADPLRSLLKVWRMLRQNGLLFIEVPNYFSPTGGLFRKKALGFQPSRYHLFIYSKQTLKAILERAGFKIHSITGSKTIKAVAIRREDTVAAKGAATAGHEEHREFRNVIAMYYYHWLINFLMIPIKLASIYIT